jgi:hypothetical protein
MKRNLEKKKEEKKRIMEGGVRQRAQSEEGGRERKLGLNVLITKMPELQDLRTFDTNPYSPRNSTYYVSELVKAYRDELSLPREHLLTSLHIMKLLERSRRPSEEEVARIRVHLPRRRGYEGTASVSQRRRRWSSTWTRR